MLRLLAVIALCVVAGAWTHGKPGIGIQVPGVSQALFSNPYYQCNTNYYISTTGNDGAAGTSLGTAWATFQHAADTVTSGVGSGSWCINVQPGTYNAGMVTINGGTTASSTGYIVWRCATLLGCIITDVGQGVGNGAMGVNGSSTSNPLVGYIWFDGFKLNSAQGLQTQFGAGFGQQATGQPANGGFCCHHLWYTNNEISGYGKGGFQSAESDFVYVVHNHIHDTGLAPNCDSGSQGSGYSQVIPWPIPGTYTLTADDKSNSVVGNMAAPNGTNQYFQQVVMYNLLHNNAEDNVGNCATDGNGIIFDTWNNIDNALTVYQHQGLIAYNLTYNNGGSGIKLFQMDGPSSHANVGIVIANNTSYNDALRTTTTSFNTAFFEGIGDSDLFINNIGYRIDQNSADYTGDSSGGTFYFASQFTNNIGFCVPPNSSCTTSSTGTNAPMFHGATWSATNKSATDPKWVNVGGIGGGSAGDVSTPPSATNFALSVSSPAIGYGLTKSYLPATSVDVGACPSSLTTCP